MACSSCGGARKQVPAEQYEVSWPDGTTKTVNSEHAARVELVMRPNGTMRKL